MSRFSSSVDGPQSNGQFGRRGTRGERSPEGGNRRLIQELAGCERSRTRSYAFRSKCCGPLFTVPMTSAFAARARSRNRLLGWCRITLSSLTR